MKVLELYELRSRYVWLKKKSVQVQHVYAFITRSRYNISADEKCRAEKRIYALISKIDSKWRTAARRRDLFMERNALWLNTEVQILDSNEKTESCLKGRPTSSFSELSRAGKLKRTAEIRAGASTEELVFSAVSGLHKNGDRKAARLLRDFFSNTGVESKRARTSEDSLTSEAEEALNLIVEAKLSKHQYLLLRERALAHKAGNMYPSYEHILQAKQDCYPSTTSITITEFKAEIELQALLDLTTCRLLSVMTIVIKTLHSNQQLNLVLVSKWGSDRSSGYSNHKQRAHDPTADDSSLYATSIVPLQLFYRDRNKRKLIVWQNPRPSSTRYCRPLKLHFTKETSSQIFEEAARVKEEIANLIPTSWSVPSTEVCVCVTHELHLSMVDGKLCNVLTGTKSTQTCYVCAAKPSQMNKLDTVLQFKADEETYKLGLSSLHAWIRCFEYLLHISYKLEVGKWQCKTDLERNMIKKKKKKVQDEFKIQTGLIIDMPKQGFGSSNDGNTARSFFHDSTLTSSITGINEDIIERFSVILHALSSGYEINVEAFKLYALDTAKKCVNLYPWYTMPPTVHKILLHGAAIIEAAPLPIGMMSEDAQESRHKDCKYNRVHHTRKASRAQGNEDLLHSCLVSSNPVITALRKLPPKRTSSLRAPVLKLLNEPQLFEPIEQYEDSSEEE